MNKEKLKMPESVNIEQNSNIKDNVINHNIENIHNKNDLDLELTFEIFERVGKELMEEYEYYLQEE